MDALHSLVGSFGAFIFDFIQWCQRLELDSQLWHHFPFTVRPLYLLPGYYYSEITLQQWRGERILYLASPQAMASNPHAAE